jgi:hypothetical protein
MLKSYFRQTIVACRPVTAKEATKQYPLLGNRLLISGYMQPLLNNVFANKHVPPEAIEQRSVFSTEFMLRCYKEDNCSRIRQSYREV